MLEFYKGKKVFITGYTGFKGSWLCKILSMAGAEVTGYALSPDEESLFNILGLSKEINSCIGDIRDYEALKSSFDRANPEVLIYHHVERLELELLALDICKFLGNILLLQLGIQL